MLRACSSSDAIAASSGSVGVAKDRKTVPPHLSQVVDCGTKSPKEVCVISYDSETPR